MGMWELRLAKAVEKTETHEEHFIKEAERIKSKKEEETSKVLINQSRHAKEEQRDCIGQCLWQDEQDHSR